VQPPPPIIVKTPRLLRGAHAEAERCVVVDAGLRRHGARGDRLRGSSRGRIARPKMRKLSAYEPGSPRAWTDRSPQGSAGRRDASCSAVAQHPASRGIVPIVRATPGL